jgi:hypothetical protein
MVSEFGIIEEREFSSIIEKVDNKNKQYSMFLS